METMARKSKIRPLGQRIARYGTGAGSALAAGFAAAPHANAAIDYYDPADLTISLGGGSIYFDLDDSAGGTLASTSSFTGADFRLNFPEYTEQPGIFTWQGNSQFHYVYSGNYFAPKLAFNDSINLGSGFLVHFAFGSLEYYGGPWDGGGEGYLGLRLQDGSSYRYGWARVNYDDADDQLTLLDFAIERTLDTSINAGAIPEPNHALLALAAGAAGLGAWRRRKRGPAGAES